MLFTTLTFLVFFAVVFVLYFCTPHRWRWAVLLCASYYFYMSWQPAYAILILLSTTTDYCIGRFLEKASHQRTRLLLLCSSLVVNCSILFAFKYFNFFAESLEFVMRLVRLPLDIPHLDVLLPVGISFYTFQTLSYTIDIYRGRIAAEKHFGIYALYVSFFPQLVAGPIERASHLLPQFFEKHRLSWQRVSDGMELFLWGVLKKLVIADQAALVVDYVYSNPTQLSGITALLATYLFAIQIYCDFSGYSDMAIGVARILGFNLMKNFNRPYIALSITDFWRRWHISLSQWFRDYVYIPLGGNRHGVKRQVMAVLIVFFVSGLWHGAQWTFVVWGLLHGLCIVLQLCMPRSITIPRWLKVCCTFHIVVLLWIFFRAATISDALLMLQTLFNVSSYQWTAMPTLVREAVASAGLYTEGLLILCGAIGVMKYVEWYGDKKVIEEQYQQRPFWKRIATAYALLLLILAFGRFAHEPFLYFQF